jgi:hypothetical protein
LQRGKQLSIIKKMQHQQPSPPALPFPPQSGFGMAFASLVLASLTPFFSDWVFYW